MKILITGFEPFDSHLNASEVLVNALTAKQDITHHANIAFAILPCNTLTLTDTINTLFEKIKPDLCLMLGQAAGRNKITLERFALNIKDFHQADNAHQQPRSELVIKEGPVAYQSTLKNMEASVAAMNTANIPAAISNHAGTYLCNQAFYQALHLCQLTPHPAYCGFIHIPILPEQVTGQHINSPFMPLDMSMHAIKILLDTYTS